MESMSNLPEVDQIPSKSMEGKEKLQDSNPALPDQCPIDKSQGTPNIKPSLCFKECHQIPSHFDEWVDIFI